MDALISHGAPVGFTDNILQLAATIIQLSFRIYRMQSGRSLLSSKATFSTEGRKLTSIEEILRCKDSRTHLWLKFKLLRRRIKLPIAEAAYTGSFMLFVSLCCYG